jgi:lipopolysaccharide/colanic/teichoic acid biosynthesis glycosyltransferase
MDWPAATSRPTWYHYGKPVVDFLLALVLGLLAIPVVLLAGLLVKLTSRGPIFYSQARMGRSGKPFTIYKLRSMRHQCESKSGPQWSTPGDPRITFIGRILRKTHIDELPQLWNVLRGEMSLAGPRPERPEFVPQLAKHIPGYNLRLLVKPGITGLAQVQLPPDTDLESVRRKLACDIYYIHRMSLWLDLRLLFCTGLVFAGIPYSFSRRLLRIPCSSRAEKAYTEATSRTPVTAELQPA